MTVIRSKLKLSEHDLTEVRGAECWSSAIGEMKHCDVFMSYNRTKI